MAALLLAATLATGASGQVSDSEQPQLSLKAGTSRVVYEREKGDFIYLEPGMHLAATGAPFDIRLHRDNYVDPLEVWQVLPGPGNSTQERALPLEIAGDLNGLDDFFFGTITNKDGEVVREMTADFCPNGYDMQRVNDEGPQTPSYPSSCGAGPFTRGMVWGLDEGWATRIYGFGDDGIRLRAGLYDVDVEIAPRYIELFSLDPATSAAHVELKVKTVDYPDYPEFPPKGSSSAPRSQNVPTDLTPDPATLPDLVPLPAWSMSVTHGKKKAHLNFSATVAVEGASSLVVEGFRREGQDVMDAYQYFNSGDEVVGRAPVGTMEYDRRDGHFHWHFQQFARYSLLNADQSEIALSRKESFCLAATDAIDLLIPGVRWRVENSDLSTACGSEDSLWVREILPLGWADTYTQSLPGQSFNITDLPNGKYFVSVEANSEGLLYEQNMDNNVELREIHLKGKGLDRRVFVPPWNGIDTDPQRSGNGGSDHH
jgi:hypothetical protein